MTRIVALGDSFVSGEGVGIRVAPESVWSALVAAAVPGAVYTSYATSGARVHDVLEHQLPRVGSTAFATVAVGLNDIARAGWDGARVQRDFIAIARGLSEVSATVLLVRMHDPLRVLRVPPPLRGLARRRLTILNAAVDEAASLPHVEVLDLGQIEALRNMTGWAVDHVHPNPTGHAAIARGAATILRSAGHRVGPIALPHLPPTTRRQRAVWLTGHGLPYMAKNLGTFGKPALQGILRRPESHDVQCP